MEFMARVKRQKGEGDENFGPVAANVFLEDVEVSVSQSYCSTAKALCINKYFN